MKKCNLELVNFSYDRSGMEICDISRNNSSQNVVLKCPLSIWQKDDGSKATNMVAAAASGRDASLQVRLPDDASIYTAGLQAPKMAFDLIQSSDNHQFIVFTDSLSSLLALKGHELKHPSVTTLREAYSNLVQLQKSVVLAWVPSHVGIQGNDRVDALAKEVLQMDVTNIYLPHTDYRSKINGFVQS